MGKSGNCEGELEALGVEVFWFGVELPRGSESIT
jgi:hypothetical protein